MLITRVWYLLLRDGPLRPREIRQRITFHRRRPSKDSIEKALKRLRLSGCVTSSGNTFQRLYEVVTNSRPVERRGRSPGSAFGRAIGTELTRQAAWNSCGIIPSGSALERAWPMFGTKTKTEDNACLDPITSDDALRI